jgi:hypothetical protein
MAEGTATFQTKLQQQATALHEFYIALRDAGFTKSEAIQYLADLSRGEHDGEEEH